MDKQYQAIEKPKKKIIIIILTCFFAALALLADLFSVTNFFTGKDKAADYLHVSPSITPVSSPTTSLTDTIHEVNKPDTLLEYVAENLKHTNDNIDTIKIEVSDLKKDFAQLMAENKDLSTFIEKIEFAPTEFNNSDNSKISYQNIAFASISENKGNTYALQFSDKPPPKGKGRLAVRSYCDICAFSTIYIYSKGESITRNSLSRYRPDRKEITTFSYDLLPGKYIIEIKDNYLESAFFSVVIEENETLIYNFDRINPYGEGNGQICFVLKNEQARYDIQISNYRPIFVRPNVVLPRNNNGDRILTINIPVDRYSCVVKSLDEPKLMDNTKKIDLSVFIATSTSIELN